ncbi:MAG: hypothetical protein IKP88_12445 [Lachnospiraceae bacterium]|nr:hypothetical protein [Lachnospiraceae bacterium]
MKIAFWSPLHGTGATASLLAVAIALSELKKNKILVTHTHYNLNNLERPLLGNVDNGDFFRDTGIDAVIRHFKSGTVTGEHISDCSIKISENLYLLAGTKNSSREGYESGIVKNMIAHILTIIEKYYDIVLVDTNSGNNEYSKKIIEECDMVIVTLRQDRYLLDGFFENEVFSDKKIFYLFGDYDRESKYSLTNIRHLYKKIRKNNSGEIPHNTRYGDAICDEKVLRYLRMNLNEENRNCPDEYFFTALKETIDKICLFSEQITDGETEEKTCLELQPVLH